jgi:hypothetical protein
MSTDPSMRASDADREAVAERLRDAHADGRLTMPEFEERLDLTYAARTLGDLDALTRDLPPAAPSPPARRHRPAEVARPRDEGPPGWVRAAWGAWASVTFVNIAIWAAIALGPGDAPYFWPIWIGGPWGAVLLARTIFGGGPEHERPGRRDGEVDHR